MLFYLESLTLAAMLGSVCTIEYACKACKVSCCSCVHGRLELKHWKRTRPTCLAKMPLFEQETWKAMPFTVLASLLPRTSLRVFCKLNFSLWTINCRAHFVNTHALWPREGNYANAFMVWVFHSWCLNAHSKETQKLVGKVSAVMWTSRPTNCTDSGWSSWWRCAHWQVSLYVAVYVLRDS